MADTFTIEFPPEVQERDVESIETELKNVDGVQDAGSMGARSIDAQTVMLWVSVATGVVGLAKTGLPLIQNVIDMIRGKGIKGAKITLANGTSFSADEISAKELGNLIEASKT